MLDIRTAQTTLENLIRDAILFALGRRLPPVASVAELRTVGTQGQTSTTRGDDDLIPIIVSGFVTATYRWSTVSAVADDGVSVVRPDDVQATAPGRWVALPDWASEVRFSPVVGGPSFVLAQLPAGPLQSVLVLDKQFEDAEILNLIAAQLPAVVIVAEEDVPEDILIDAGTRWTTPYRFVVTSIAENLRDRREAAQGSNVPGDVDPGANTIDGFLKALLVGAGLAPAEDGLQVVRIGRGFNWVSDMGQRLVFRSRAIEFIVTEELPQAPNESAPIDSIVAQSHMAAGATPPDETTTLPMERGEADLSTYLVSGMLVAYPMPGLTQPITAGAAVLAGASVIYAGASRAFAAYSDTYRDLMPDGSMVFIEVAINGAEPPVTSTALRIGITRTTGSGVMADVVFAQTNAPYGPPFTIVP